MALFWHGFGAQTFVCVSHLVPVKESFKNEQFSNLNSYDMLTPEVKEILGHVQKKPELAVG